MRFRPCIDIHNGKVKQIVGSSLRDKNDEAKENYVASNDAVFYARMYREMGLPGGHIILLNPVGSPFYEKTKRQAIEALSACPGLMQVGGGITAANAAEFIDAGASHVIVTSYVFKDGKINYDNLRELARVVGKDKVVLDLSCKNVDGKYYIVTDRWQKLTDVELCAETLDSLSEYCDEFLVHAADVEGKQKGIEKNVAQILGDWGKIPVTYAGGAGSLDDVRELKAIGTGKVDVTIGSALEIFGGTMKIKDIVEICK
ncbi:MAG: phosphoribosylformimino-5-aminoimidazole carboxamide ribotide isomerase [Butyrivibrio sp.]|nr:phosphoribosylformimino-5-aminoimidazole carboxamide ribotide isomerase [Butyrivibrio sp.]